jgi:hypothetical protein
MVAALEAMRIMTSSTVVYGIRDKADEHANVGGRSGPRIQPLRFARRKVDVSIIRNLLNVHDRGPEVALLVAGLRFCHEPAFLTSN